MENNRNSIKIQIKSIFVIIIFLLLTSISQGQVKEVINLNNSGSWTMVLIPDLQTYSKFDYNQPIMDIINNWIKINKKRLNIELVLFTGDFVEQNNISMPDGINGNQTSQQQWEAVSNSFKKLDEVVPYITCTGNHDYGIRKAENRYSQFNSYFPKNRNSLTEKLLVQVLPNAEGAETLENAFYEFVSPHDTKFIIGSLEFNPRDTIVQSAYTFFNQEKYKDWLGIVLTHSYMDSFANRIVSEDYLLKDVTHGDMLWQKLIAISRNINMVFCGHIADNDSHRGQVGYRVDKNNTRNKDVHQIMFNAQCEGGGWHGNGGDGWIRIFEFLPDKKTVVVKTFSPLFAISPTTVQYSLRKKSYDHFTFILK